MTKNNLKKDSMKKPIERHDTAAWINHINMKPVSRVMIPDEIDVSNAKDYVDANQK